MPIKTVVIFANSIKHRQHCIAGKCIETGEWIRPVANVDGRELSHDQAKYVNPYGTYSVKVKQKIIMDLGGPAPLLHQPENYLITNTVWQQSYSIQDAQLVNYLDSPDSLWGLNDRVNYSTIQLGMLTINQSLYLVQTENIALYKNEYDKRRARFTYNGIDYDFAVTDPKFDDLLAADQPLSGIVCISLGEVYEGNCYKLVASIF
jgi:hypothetical protein